MTQTTEMPTTEPVPVNRAMEVAEIETQITTAKRYPRDIAKFKDKLMTMANLDQETAESCYYALPRAGKPIDGPSVRLAEIAVCCYQNLIAEADVVGEDDRYVYALGWCRDLENNNAIRMKVRRRITYKDGTRYNDDMIAVTANAACAIALRNAIFKIIPGAYIKSVFDAVKKTAVGKANSFTARRDEVVKRLGRFGVTPDRVLGVLGRRSVDEITFNDVAQLIGLGTAIKEGDTTVEEAFPVPFEDEAAEALAKNAAESGTEPIGSQPQEKKRRGRKPKAKKQDEPQVGKPVSEQTPEHRPGYFCTPCGLEFDEPRKVPGPDGEFVETCPRCKSLKINQLPQQVQEPVFLDD